MKRTLRLGLAAASLQFLTGNPAEANSLAPPAPAAVGPGPVEVASHPDPLSLLQDTDPARAANKRLVFDMWRSIVNAGQIELADEMLQEDYIQHSPILPTGREAFKKIFSVVKRRDIPELVSPPMVTSLAEGNLVVMALREELPEPDGGGHYTTTHFNLFRIEGGRLAEHWHSIQDAPGAGVLPPGEGGPQRVTGLIGAVQASLLLSPDPVLEANKRLVFDAGRLLNEAGREDLASQYLAENYIEHDPNLDTGREAFERRLREQPDAPVSASLQAPIVALLAQGDLVVLVTARSHPHPVRAGDTYTTTWFDMFRLRDGRIAEHWDGASKPGTPGQDYGN